MMFGRESCMMAIDSLLASPEDRALEFKPDLSAPKSILRTLVVFANTVGDTLNDGCADDGNNDGVNDVFEEQI